MLKLRLLLAALLLTTAVGVCNIACCSSDDDATEQTSQKRTELFNSLKAIAIANPDGFTVDATTLKPITSGYAVSVADTQNSFLDEGLYRVIDYVMSHPEINAYGGWLNTETQDYYYDATMVLSDRDEAIAFGKKNGQPVIFDLNTMTEIWIDGSD